MESSCASLTTAISWSPKAYACLVIENVAFAHCLCFPITDMKHDKIKNQKQTAVTLFRCPLWISALHFVCHYLHIVVLSFYHMCLAWAISTLFHWHCMLFVFMLCPPLLCFFISLELAKFTLCRITFCHNASCRFKFRCTSFSCFMFCRILICLCSNTRTAFCCCTFCGFKGYFISFLGFIHWDVMLHVTFCHTAFFTISRIAWVRNLFSLMKQRYKLNPERLSVRAPILFVQLTHYFAFSFLQLLLYLMTHQWFYKDLIYGPLVYCTIRSPVALQQIWSLVD